MSATPLRGIFPQFLAMIVQFYGTGKAAAAIIAAGAAIADSLAQSYFLLIYFFICWGEIAGNAGLGVGVDGWGGDVVRILCQFVLAMSVQCLQDFTGHHGAVLVL